MTTLIAFATEDFDSNNNFDNSAGNYKYTAPTTGYYDIHACVDAVTSPAGFVGGSMIVKKNGSDFLISTFSPYPGYNNGTAANFNINRTVLLNAGDYLQVYLSLDIINNTTYTAQVLGTSFNGHIFSV